ncbi:MAG: MbtH domain protein [Bacteroidetes bacterium]|nr:MAG: MbtH domain protein [Bacteroidota bacterium]
MNELVERLSKGKHPVEVERAEGTAKDLKLRIDEHNYVHILFKKTGTEIGIKLDRENCIFSKGDFQKGTGTIQLSGGLTLNYERVRCIADINLKTLQGKGYLLSISEKEYNSFMQQGEL